MAELEEQLSSTREALREETEGHREDIETLQAQLRDERCVFSGLPQQFAAHASSQEIRDIFLPLFQVAPMSFFHFRLDDCRMYLELGAREVILSMNKLDTVGRAVYFIISPIVYMDTDTLVLEVWDESYRL